ncbi:DUF4432 family protein [Xaviernesmea rhizosphaerae]
MTEVAVAGREQDDRFLLMQATGIDLALAFDRGSALDLGPARLDGIDLAPGLAIPSDGDPRIDHALQGLLFTCGPDHIRHPEPVEGRSAGDSGARYPLHGSLSATPVTAPQRTQAADGTLHLSGMAEIALADGGLARLHRRWQLAPDGTLSLSDSLENAGSAGFAPMMMYHINLGAQLFGPQTRVAGAMLEEGGLGWHFGAGESSHVCLPAASGAQDGWASVRLGPLPGAGGAWLQLDFALEGLPFLQMWRRQSGVANVFALEPASHRIARRPVLREAGELVDLAPGERRNFALRLAVLRA